MVTAVEIAPQPVQASPSMQVFKKEKTPVETPPVVKIPAEVEKPLPKPVPKKEPKKSEMDKICKADEVVEVSPRPAQRKPLNLAKMMERKIQQENKPKKKVVSLRDIPGDEIFIPLTGPEVDFEEIIRKSSPKLSRKEPSEDTPDVIFIPLHSPPKEKEEFIRKSPPKLRRKEPSEDNPDMIYIPLHSPPKEKEEFIRKSPPKLRRKEPSEDNPNMIYIPLHSPPKEKEESIRKSPPKLCRREPSEDNPNVIYIPLHSPPKEKKVQVEVRGVSERVSEPLSGTRSPGKAPKPYEICEDGSIFIPLHTPDEEKGSRTFEEEIRRVERELQRVKAVEAERRERERDQQKPATLDLNDASASRTRLSQSYPGKQGNLVSFNSGFFHLVISTHTKLLKASL